MAPKEVFKIASIPGDGIGVEVTLAAKQVLDKLAETSANKFAFEYTDYDWSSERYLERGWYMPPDGMAQLDKADAILFGAVGLPTVPDHISLWNLLLPIRKALNQYVNLRPVEIFPGITPPLTSCATDPSKLNWVIVRENSEGEYAGQGGTSHADSAFTTATELAIFTRPALERIFRFAFAIAASRPARRLTLVTKSNAQRHGMVLWDAVFAEVAAEHAAAGKPEVHVDRMLVDAMTVRMVARPESLDTIVATNLHADILSDLAAALGGSIGIAPSANLDPTRRHPSLFEPIHGSAPDIMGRGVANPLGAFWSAAELVRWCAGRGAAAHDEQGLPVGNGVEGMVEAADRLMAAVKAVVAAGVTTRDLGGDRDTRAVTEAVCGELERTALKQ